MSSEFTAKFFVELLDELKASKKQQKQAIIQSLLDPSLSYHDQVVWVLHALMDPYQRFHVKIAPPKGGDRTKDGLCALSTPDSEWESGRGLRVLLGQLFGREITGNDARDAVCRFLDQCDGASHELLYRILKKDPRCGASSTTFNAIAPVAIPKFDCSLAQPYEERHVAGWPVMAEKKYDGMRALIEVDVEKREAHPLSRNGLPIPALNHLMGQVVDAGLRPDSHFIDCEVQKSGDRDFEQSISSARSHAPAEGMELKVFAVVPRADYLRGSYKTNREVREELTQIFQESKAIPSFMSPSECWEVGSHEEVMLLFGQLLEKGQEGLVLKQPNWEYLCKRNRGWLKTKDVKDLDAEVIGIFGGEAGTKYEGKLGGVVIDVDGVEVRVGSGFSDAERSLLWDDPQSILGHVVEVRYHEKTPDGSLRHPRFVRVRFDKDADNL